MRMPIRRACSARTAEVDPARITPIAMMNSRRFILLTRPAPDCDGLFDHGRQPPTSGLDEPNCPLRVMNAKAPGQHNTSAFGRIATKLDRTTHAWLCPVA